MEYATERRTTDLRFLVRLKCDEQRQNWRSRLARSWKATAHWKSAGSLVPSAPERVTFYGGVRIGHRVEVHSGAVLGADGFGFAQGDGSYWKFPQAGIVEIGDDVEIGANTTIDRGSLEDTRIGEGVKLDNLVHVGHNCQIGAHSVVAAQAGLSGSCVFGKRVVVGGQAGFGERCRLEDGAVIGGQSGVLGGKIVRSGETVWGTPSRPLQKFKDLYAWFARLPELAARIKELEGKLGGK